MSQSVRPIDTAKLNKLRPTQMTVGMAEVEAKRQDWRDVAKDHRQTFLIHHAFPAVRGAEGRYFIVDHHHLGRALIEEEVETAFVTVLADLSRLAPAEFWTVMDHHQWVHPYDDAGRRRNFEDIPGKLNKLVDDPYRSLAGAVRDNGGYAKETAPFAEFLWADFFRRRISEKDLKNNRDHDRAVQVALALCHSPEAEHLPGWSGPAHKAS